MANKNTTALGDLQTILRKYRDLLKDAEKRTTQKFDDEGKLHPVKHADVAAAATALDDAERAVTKICEQATLAISVE